MKKPVMEMAEYKKNLVKELNSLLAKDIMAVAEILETGRRTGKNVFVMGNGGSAATASHLACDLNKGVSYGKRNRYRVICLNDSVPTMLAYANDANYTAIFEEQLRNHLRPDDIVIGISGSGQSTNIVRALEYANANGAETIALVGFSGGRAKEMAKHSIHIEIDDMQIVEDMHMIVCHLLSRLAGIMDTDKL